MSDWTVDFSVIDFEHPAPVDILGLGECRACAGEGYHYAERAGRHVEHPVVEALCRSCNGTGVA